jgi:translation initiation factor 2 alpha subunit (eIF-2alpha)
MVCCTINLLLIYDCFSPALLWFVQDMYQQITWPLYKAYGHAFDAFKNMVQDEGEAIFKKLEDDRGSPLPTLTPAVSRHVGHCVTSAWKVF